MKQASRDMWNVIKDNPRERSRFTQGQLDDVRKGSDRIDGYTWHHNAQSSPHNMQLVPRNIHEAVRHIGQAALDKGN